MALLTRMIEIDVQQVQLENRILDIVRENPNIGLSEVSKQLNDENSTYSYTFQTALINLISSGKLLLTLDRNLLINS